MEDCNRKNNNVLTSICIYHEVEAEFEDLLTVREELVETTTILSVTGTCSFQNYGY